MMLCCLQNIKKHEILLLLSKGSLKAKNRYNLTPVISMLLCLQTHDKVMQLHPVQKLLSMESFKITSWQGPKYFTMEFHQVPEKPFLQHGNQYFLIRKKNIFVETICQVMNFDTNLIGCHFRCLLLQAYTEHQTQH